MLASTLTESSASSIAVSEIYKPKVRQVLDSFHFFVFAFKPSKNDTRLRGVLVSSSFTVDAPPSVTAPGLSDQQSAHTGQGRPFWATLRVAFNALLLSNTTHCSRLHLDTCCPDLAWSFLIVVPSGGKFILDSDLFLAT